MIVQIIYWTILIVCLLVSGASAVYCVWSVIRNLTTN